jgi:hypothetical protein
MWEVTAVNMTDFGKGTTLHYLHDNNPQCTLSDVQLNTILKLSEPINMSEFSMAIELEGIRLINCFVENRNSCNILIG